MEMMLNKIVPEGLQYRHSCEGPDDMVSNIIIISIDLIATLQYWTTLPQKSAVKSVFKSLRKYDIVGVVDFV